MIASVCALMEHRAIRAKNISRCVAARHCAMLLVADSVVAFGELLAHAHLALPLLIRRPSRFACTEGIFLVERHDSVHAPVPQPPALKALAEPSTTLIRIRRVVKRRRYAVAERCEFVVLRVATVRKPLSISTMQLLAWHARHTSRRKLRSCEVKSPPTAITAMEPLKAIEVLKKICVLLGSLLPLEVLVHLR